MDEAVKQISKFLDRPQFSSEENMSMKEKVVIITGAAAGIGAATAKLFAGNGAHLSLIDIDAEGLKKVETTAGL